MAAYSFFTDRSGYQIRPFAGGIYCPNPEEWERPYFSHIPDQSTHFNQQCDQDRQRIRVNHQDTIRLGTSNPSSISLFEKQRKLTIPVSLRSCASRKWSLLLRSTPSRRSTPLPSSVTSLTATRPSRYNPTSHQKDEHGSFHCIGTRIRKDKSHQDNVTTGCRRQQKRSLYKEQVFYDRLFWTYKETLHCITGPSRKKP